jgi:hypothetical protein
MITGVISVMQLYSTVIVQEAKIGVNDPFGRALACFPRLESDTEAFGVEQMLKQGGRDLYMRISIS